MRDMSNQSYEDIGRQFVARWQGSDAEAFAALFSENGEYVDPAFGIFRRGRGFMHKHHQLWHRAVSNFSMVSERIIAGEADVVVLAICEGVFDGDSLGGGVVAPTGKPFRARMCAVLTIDAHGQITRATDYYDRAMMPGGQPAPMRDLDAI